MKISTQQAKESVPNLKYLFFFLIILAIGLLLLGSQMVISGLYKAQSQLFLEHWGKSTSAPNEKPWHIAYSASQKAIDYYPVKHAPLYELKGKVIQWQTFNKTADDPEVLELRQEALASYRQQIQITPKWPWAWLNLLAIKIEMNQIDSEFYNAWNQVKLISNQHPKIQTAVTQIGIQSWKNLSNKYKIEALDNVIHEIAKSKRHANAIKPLLASYNLLKTTCLYATKKQAKTHDICTSQTNAKATK